MKKIRAYFKSWLHNLKCHQSGYKNGEYTITEPWFRINLYPFGSILIWRTIKIACLCGKVFYDIDDKMI